MKAVECQLVKVLLTLQRSVTSSGQAPTFSYASWGSRCCYLDVLGANGPGGSPNA